MKFDFFTTNINPSILLLLPFVLLACSVVRFLLVGACERSEAERGAAWSKTTSKAISVLLGLDTTWDLLCRIARAIVLSVFLVAQCVSDV